MNDWRLRTLACLCLLYLPALSADERVDRPSAPTMRSDYSRSALLSQQVTDLTLGDAVYLGLRNNRSIRSSYLQRVAQKFDLRVAEDVFNPKLLITGNYRTTRGSSDTTQNLNMAPATSLLSEYGTRLSMAWIQDLNKADRAGRQRSDGLDLAIIQPLLRGAGWDVTTAPLRLARITEQSNRLNLKAGVAQTITAIITTYRELLRSQEQLTIAQEALKRANALLEVNRALISAGRMAEFEIVQTEADIASQELGVEEARNQVDVNRLSLLRLLALDMHVQPDPRQRGPAGGQDQHRPARGPAPCADPAARIPGYPAGQPAGRSEPGDRQGPVALGRIPGGRGQPDPQPL